MEKLIRAYLTDAEISQLSNGIGYSIGTIKPKCTSLNDIERKGLRTMAEGREGFARTTCRIALNFTDVLPRNENPTEMEAALLYYDQLALVKEKIARLLEMVDDTAQAQSADIMVYADRYCAYLQAARTGNTSLDAAMDQIDEYNKRFGVRGGQDEETPAEPGV